MSVLSSLKSVNDKFALSLSKAYGTPVAIWLCIIFCVFGAFVTASTLNKMTFWSNAVQLVFCPLSIYVNTILMKHQKNHKETIDDLHNKIDAVHAHLGIEKK